MKPKFCLSLFLFFTFWINPTFAAVNTFICPSGYQTVALGYTQEQVLAACGKPTEQHDGTEQVNQPMQMTQWVYNLGAVNINNKVLVNVPQLTITFANGKVVQVNASNDAFTKIFTCSPQQEKLLGLDQQTVLRICGYPVSMNTITQSQSTTQQVSFWTYKTDDYTPPTILKFVEGKLAAINR